MNGVVLITIDALRCDHLSYMGTVSDTTPFLDSLAENGTSFTRHYSTGSGTSTSFPGIHASSLPLDHGYRGLSTEHKSLAECLQTESVQTLGVTAQTSCSRLFDYHRGFDTFQDWIEEDGLDQEGRVSLPSIWNQLRQTIKKTPVLRILGRSAIKLYRDFRPRSCPYRRASEVTDMSLSLIQNDINLDRRFFIWIHYMEPHAPYFPPDSYVSKFYDGNLTRREVNKAHRRIYESGPEIADGTMVESASQAEINAIRGYYAAATKYVDDEIRQLYSGLSDMGILEEAGLFVTADHGEELFDHGDLDHRPKMYEELLHIPMIYSPPLSSELIIERIMQLTSHLDLAPTIADFLQMECPDQWRGHSLKSILNGESRSTSRNNCIAELCHTSGLGGSVQPEKYVGAVLTDRWKYIYNRQRNTEGLYDLLEDPEEQTDLIDQESGRAQELRSLIESRIDSVSESKHSVGLSGAAKNRLEKLGYLQE